jgi:hypothetical protein
MPRRKTWKVDVKDGYFRCPRCRALIRAELLDTHRANHAKMPISSPRKKKGRTKPRRKEPPMARDDETTSVKTVSGGLPSLGKRR